MEITISVKENSIDENTLVINGLPFTEKNGTYHYTCKSFKFESAYPLYIRYNNENAQQTAFIQSSNVTQTHVSDIRSSSSQTNYPVNNLVDENYTTAWVPQNNGIGEWFEVSLKPLHLGAIIMLSGYMKSEEAYYNNNRVKKIKIEYAMKIYDDEEQKDEFEVELEDLPYKENISNHLYSKVATSFGESTYGLVTKLKITIVDVYKGNKYNDTCISEILLLSNWFSDPE